MQPTPAELHHLRLRAKGGDQVAQHALKTIEALNAGGVPIGGHRPAPPGFKLMDMGTVKLHPLPCGACGSKLFEKLQYAEAFYDENDPSHEWCGKPTSVTICAKCGSEQVVTEIRRHGNDPKEPEVRYEYSTRTFKVGIQQIQQILAEQRVQMVNQMADVIDEYFGKEREKESSALAEKICIAFGMKLDGPAAPATPPQTPAAEPAQEPAPKSSIITEV